MAPYLTSLLKYKLIFFLLSSMVTLSFCNNRTTYIVFMNPSLKPTPVQTHSLWYASHLKSLSIDPSRHLLYSYSSLITAFAASLRSDHLPVLRSHPAVVLIYPEPVFWPLTTRTPLFLGLPTISPPPSLSSSSDVIVGVLDTGVWPESASFSDSGFSPIPSRWRGQCESAIDFTPSLCNRKLIGARSFSHGFRAASAEDPKQQEHFSARDVDGHGTHTASTAVGSPASNASLLGYASGTARGMAPFARLAVYKVCWTSGCFGSDILAAMEQSITDGVDVLSISLGGSSTTLSRDPIATGALAAIARGIFVSCSAGNSGPGLATLANTAPWIATIGAGTLDRDFPAYVSLGNGERFAGVSLSSGQGVSSKPVPIVYGKGSQSNANTSKLCLSGSLNATEVTGKVVFCDRGVIPRVEKGLVVKEAGGVGMILANTAVNGEELVADSHLLPAVAVGVKEGDDIRKYVTSVSNPTAVLSFRGTVVDIRPSPVVAAFSSRGPSTVVPGILKPDLIGPGVNILAGWTGVVGPTGLEKDNRRSEFNILSGTSMSCPHISGVAALLKAAHPTWSPSAIKSALMTTAYVVDNTGSGIRDASGGMLATPLAYGSGYVNPQKALSPGLIYDATHDEYVAFLCLVEPNIKVIQSITRNANIKCSKKLANQGSLNYPSFSIVFNGKVSKAQKYSRVVTNVGPPGSSYTVEVDGPASVGVVVEPAKLVFKKTGQKLRYTVSFTSKKGHGSAAEMEFGSITWNDGQHNVRSAVSYAWSLP